MSEIQNKIAEIDAEHPAAAEALRMASVLADAPLPAEFALGMEGTPHNPALLNPAAAVFAVAAIMDPLCTRELAESDDLSGVFSIPFQVKETVVDAMDETELGDWVTRAGYSLNLVLPDADPQNWAAAKPLMPHVHTLRARCRETGVATEALVRVLHQAAFFLHFSGDHPGGAMLLEDASAMDEKLKGEAHPDVASDCEGLAEMYAAAGEQDKAMAALERALRLREELYTENNQVLLTPLAGLASMYAEAGRKDDARTMVDRMRAVMQANDIETDELDAFCEHVLGA